MKRVFLLRHAECPGSGYCGAGSDPGLSPEGLRQAEAITRALEELRPDRIYSSPLQRCLQTVEPYRRTHPESIRVVRNALKELDFGEWEGAAADFLGTNDPQRFNAWIADPVNCAPPGGETLEDLRQRVLAFWCGEIETGDGDTVVVVSHGGPLRILLAEAAGAGLSGHWRFSVDRGRFSCIALFEDGVSQIKCVNLTGRCISEVFTCKE